MKKFLNKICFIGAGAFSNQLIQDINNFKYKIYFNKKRLFLNFFYMEDSRELKENKKNLYLITVAKPDIKEKIINEYKNLNYIDGIFVDSSVSKKLKYNKNLVVWKSFIGDDVFIDNNVYIGPYSIIAKNVKIGKNVSIYPRVSLLKDSSIGNNVIIGSNSVIVDGVKIEDNCIIGPNITVYNDLTKGTILIK